MGKEVWREGERERGDTFCLYREGRFRGARWRESVNDWPQHCHASGTLSLALCNFNCLAIEFLMDRQIFDLLFRI